MKPHPFTDAAGREWGIFDFRVVGAGRDAKRYAVPVGDRDAEARAFVPIRRVGAVMIYMFGPVAYHGVTPRTFERQLRYARPLGADAVEPVDPT
jgi:hypothetical protein